MRSLSPKCTWYFKFVSHNPGLFGFSYPGNDWFNEGSTKGTISDSDFLHTYTCCKPLAELTIQIMAINSAVPIYGCFAICICGFHYSFPFFGMSSPGVCFTTQICNSTSKVIWFTLKLLLEFCIFARMCFKICWG